ncbi:MAG: hypothetical protein ACP5KN_19630 [Armatimonadota bacterium]
MRLGLTVLCAMLSCTPVLAQGLLTIESATFEVIPTPIERLTGDVPPEMLRVQVSATDASPADAIQLDAERTVLALGIGEEPLHLLESSLDAQRNEGEPWRVAAELWFEVPDQELMKQASLRLVLARYRLETAEFTWEQGEGWQFPLTASTGWLTATVTGVGIGQVLAGAPSIRRWLGEGAEGHGDVTEVAATVGKPSLLGFVNVKALVPPDSMHDIALVLGSGDTAIAPGHVSEQARTEAGIADTDLELATHQYVFDYADSIEADTADQLPPVTSLTLRVVRRIPLEESWTAVTAPAEPQPQGEQAEDQGAQPEEQAQPEAEEQAEGEQ